MGGEREPRGVEKGEGRRRGGGVEYAEGMRGGEEKRETEVKEGSQALHVSPANRITS